MAQASVHIQELTEQTCYFWFLPYVYAIPGCQFLLFSNMAPTSPVFNDEGF